MTEIFKEPVMYLISTKNEMMNTEDCYIGVLLRKLSPGAEFFGSCRSFAPRNCRNRSINTVMIQDNSNGRFHEMTGNSHG